jgi:hypothetical protein
MKCGPALLAVGQQIEAARSCSCRMTIVASFLRLAQRSPSRRNGPRCAPRSGEPVRRGKLPTVVVAIGGQIHLMIPDARDLHARVLDLYFRLSAISTPVIPSMT